MKSPSSGSWDIGQRFWANHSFSNDVISIALTNDDNRIFVTTSRVYGSGKLYLIDLLNKEIKNITTYENEIKESQYFENYGLVITAIDEIAKKITIQIDYYGMRENTIKQFLYE